jgi:hypothetical protein
MMGGTWAHPSIAYRRFTWNYLVMLSGYGLDLFDVGRATLDRKDSP